MCRLRDDANAGHIDIPLNVPTLIAQLNNTVSKSAGAIQGIGQIIAAERVTVFSALELELSPHFSWTQQPQGLPLSFPYR
jgi:hypothetical protein